MKILIDIGHPAHVHYFKNFIRIMKDNGHNILITARDKEISHYLLEKEGLKFHSRGKGSDSFIGKLAYMFRADWFLYKKAREFKPDFFLSFSSPYAAQVSFLMRKPHIAFDDTEHALIGRLFYRPFTDLILSPSSYKGKLAKKQCKFDSFMELCYLNPKYFKPSKELLLKRGVDVSKPYAVIRFVKWAANHDFGHNGFSIENKLKLVKKISKFANVYITSESELPESLSEYIIAVKPDEIHHLLAFSSLLVGESATMASEAAMLGVPSIFVDDVGRGYTTHLESEYGIVSNFNESEEGQLSAINRAAEILKENNDYKQIQNLILNDSIDVTELMVDVFCNYEDRDNVLKKYDINYNMQLE